MANPDVTVATVCGGSLALAMAGLLEGRNAVTHVLGLDVLEATGVNVVRARVVDDGDLVTAGGVTSGLDLALHLLERSYGPRVAIAVEKLFEYERRGTVWTMSIVGDWDVTIKTPIGSLAFALHVHRRGWRHRGQRDRPGRDCAAARYRRHQ